MSNYFNEHRFALSFDGKYICQHSPFWVCKQEMRKQMKSSDIILANYDKFILEDEQNSRQFHIAAKMHNEIYKPLNKEKS